MNQTGKRRLVLSGTGCSLLIGGLVSVLVSLVSLNPNLSVVCMPAALLALVLGSGIGVVVVVLRGGLATTLAGVVLSWLVGWVPVWLLLRTFRGLPNSLIVWIVGWAISGILVGCLPALFARLGKERSAKN